MIVSALKYTLKPPTLPKCTAAYKLYVYIFRVASLVSLASAIALHLPAHVSGLMWVPQQLSVGSLTKV